MEPTPQQTEWTVDEDILKPRVGKCETLYNCSNTVCNSKTLKYGTCHKLLMWFRQIPQYPVEYFRDSLQKRTQIAAQFCILPCGFHGRIATFGGLLMLMSSGS